MWSPAGRNPGFGGTRSDRAKEIRKLGLAPGIVSDARRLSLDFVPHPETDRPAGESPGEEMAESSSASQAAPPPIREASRHLPSVVALARATTPPGDDPPPHPASRDARRSLILQVSEKKDPRRRSFLERARVGRFDHFSFSRVVLHDAED